MVNRIFGYVRQEGRKNGRWEKMDESHLDTFLRLFLLRCRGEDCITKSQLTSVEGATIRSADVVLHPLFVKDCLELYQKIAGEMSIGNCCTFSECQPYPEKLRGGRYLVCGLVIGWLTSGGTAVPLLAGVGGYVFGSTCTALDRTTMITLKVLDTTKECQALAEELELGWQDDFISSKSVENESTVTLDA